VQGIYPQNGVAEYPRSLRQVAGPSIQAGRQVPQAVPVNARYEGSVARAGRCPGTVAGGSRCSRSVQAGRQQQWAVAGRHGRQAGGAVVGRCVQVSAWAGRQQVKAVQGGAGRQSQKPQACRMAAQDGSLAAQAGARTSCSAGPAPVHSRQQASADLHAVASRYGGAQEAAPGGGRQVAGARRYPGRQAGRRGAAQGGRQWAVRHRVRREAADPSTVSWRWQVPYPGRRECRGACNSEQAWWRWRQRGRCSVARCGRHAQ